MVTLILVASVAFVATNLDDLFVLLSLFSDPSLTVGEVVAGQYLGMAILVGVALTGSLAAVEIPGHSAGLLGLLPLAMGLRRLWVGGDEPVHHRRRSAGASLGKVMTAAALTTASGGDNVAIYVPLLLGKSRFEGVVIVAVFAVMTAAWCSVAQLALIHPRIGVPIRRLGPSLVPWVYIALGAYSIAASGAWRSNAF